MKPNSQLRSAVRGFYAWIGSMVILMVAPIFALQLADSPSTAARVAAVLVGAGGMLPWMGIVYLLIRRGDEFVRRMHLVALAWAFGGAILLMAVLGWMVSARFIKHPDLRIVMGGTLVIWVIALFGAKFYFERER